MLTRLSSPPPTPSAAAGAWSAAAEACTANGQHALRPYALLRQAEATLETAGPRRGRATAGPMLVEARDLAAGMGAAPLLGQIEALARRSRIDLGAAGPPRCGRIGKLDD